MPGSPPEHLIHLRKAWQGVPRSGQAAAPSRIDLPISGTELARFESISRKFHAPPLSPELETIVLRLRHVAGIRCLTLNDRMLLSPDSLVDLPDGSVDLPIDDLLEQTNRLMIHFDPERVAVCDDWGQISLAISARF